MNSPMGLWSFTSGDFTVISDALDIAEDVTSNFFKFSAEQWKRHQYDIKTLSSLKGCEISPYAFAMLSKGVEKEPYSGPWKRKRDFYFICLQDHQIKKALNRDRKLDFLPLLVYVFTHELVHIIRFSHFFQRFNIAGEKKEEEEKVVHGITYKILKKLSLPRLDYVLDSYKRYRICEISMS